MQEKYSKASAGTFSNTTRPEFWFGVYSHPRLHVS